MGVPANHTASMVCSRPGYQTCFWMRLYRLPVTWLCKLIYVKLTTEELSRHCWRRTCWKVETLWNNRRDPLGYGRVHRFRWKHIVWQQNCQYFGKQVQVFTRFQGSCTVHCYRAHNKGMELQVLHCARDTTLLESFHLHLASYVILVLFYEAFLIATIQHPLC